MKYSDKIGTFIFIILLSPWVSAIAENSMNDSAMKGEEAKMADFFNHRYQTINAQWNNNVSKTNERHRRLQKEIEDRWGKQQASTNFVWVSYSEDISIKNKIDFQNGKVTLEVLSETISTPESMIGRLTRHLKKLLSSKDDNGSFFLKDMIDEYTTSYSSIKEKLNIFSEYNSPEKFKISFDMVPDHIAKRAKKYFHLIVDEAKKNNVDPYLVLAIVHTESAFNPMATSHIPAYGLMQLVPKWAAKEAYRDIYDKEMTPTASYLYNPKNNVELGVAYLRLLDNNYFHFIDSYDNRQLVVIAAYNWGPTVLKQKIISRMDVNKTSKNDLFSQLSSELPDETRIYLTNVLNRIQLYKSDT